MKPRRRTGNREQRTRMQALFLPRFLENSTHIPMRSCSQASVLQLFCRMCVRLCVCLYCLMPWKQSEDGLLWWFATMGGLTSAVRSVVGCAAHNQNNWKYLGSFSFVHKPFASIASFHSVRNRFCRLQNHPSCIIHVNKEPAFCHFLCCVICCFAVSLLFSDQCKHSGTSHWRKNISLTE